MNKNKLVDIGPECFADGDEEVISYKGANYYKACDAFVAELPDGAVSHCVKRVYHLGLIHEDYDGRTRKESMVDHLADVIYDLSPWEGETYQAAAEHIAAELINKGWRKL